MDSGPKTLNFVNGRFEWDIYTNGLIFISNESPPLVTETQQTKTGLKNTSAPGHYDITFKDDIDLHDKLRFRKFYQRRRRHDEKQVVILQDVKDVALFTANPKQLTLEFIDFLHIPIVDRFLRALIIYFQFYFEVWERVMVRRDEIRYKIKQPICKIIENSIRDDLADLRSMLSKEYCSMLFGAKDSKRYHHMANKNNVSLSDRDRRFYEMLFKMATRIVWFALHKPTLSIIELEIDRLFRTHYFNKFVHSGWKTPALHTYEHENRILYGASDIDQRRLVAMSPTGKETIISDHDHRMLAIGQVTFPPSDERLRFCEMIFLLEEERFAENGVCIGILGMPRDNFDPLLKEKRKKMTDDDTSKAELTFSFTIPPRIYHSDDTIPPAYPQTPPRFLPSLAKQKIIRHQKQLWKTRTERTFQLEDNLTQEFTITSLSQSAIV